MYMSVKSLEELQNILNLTDAEKSWHESPISLPVLITDYYMNLIDKKNPDDPLRKQVVPSSKENLNLNLEDNDPLREETHSKGKRLIHRYTNRVAFLATDICFQYCRHCFRRRFTGNMQGKASKEEVLNTAEYLTKHPEIKEMLFTGGDVLTLSDNEIFEMLSTFRKANPKLIIRICTRACAVFPERITDNLIDVFKQLNTAPFYLMTQFNHPRELTDQAVQAVAKFVDAGIPAMNQSVLLRGVNDNADVLEELSNKLLFARIKPYYLFQGDLVTGTGEFRVPLAKGMKLEKELRQRVSGLGMPAYTADLPDGGGKVPLSGCYVEGFENGVWNLRTLTGQLRSYPDPN